VTEALWRELYSSESIHLNALPQKRKELESSLKSFTSQLMAFDTAIWKFKKEKNIALSQPLNAIVYAAKGLDTFEYDLKAMHKIKEIRFGKPPEKTKTRLLDNDTFVVEEDTE
jgi:valyl-tRNA synthetase